MDEKLNINARIKKVGILITINNATDPDIMADKTEKLIRNLQKKGIAASVKSFTKDGITITTEGFGDDT
jgi:hypothetical protein